MKLGQLISSMDIIRSTAESSLEISSVCLDSRTVKPGCLFVTFSGLDFDGHDFISSAVEKGAVAVVCEREPEVDVPYILVENGRIALATISDNWFGHPSGEMQVIGITGTNGKTTTSYLIKSILESTGAKVGLIGTICQMIGNRIVETGCTTPESYQLQELLRQMADVGCQYVVMEISACGMALHRVDKTRFAVGIFTNLTEDHLDYFKTMEAYGEAKAQFFEYCPICVLNCDDPAWNLMKAHAAGKVLTYSIKNSNANLRAENIRLGFDRVEMDAIYGKEVGHIELAIPGIFSVYNALAAALGVMSLGFTLKDATALRYAKGVKGRLEVMPTPGRDYTILIDYAHTPDALENVLHAVHDFAKGRVVVVFGCGGDRDPLKRPIMGEIATRLADFVIVTSDNPRTENPNEILQEILVGMKGTGTPYVVIENRCEAIAWAMDHAKKGDIILLAGKGHETYQIIGHEQKHLDEREVIAEHLATGAGFRQ